MQPRTSELICPADGARPANRLNNRARARATQRAELAGLRTLPPRATGTTSRLAAATLSSGRGCKRAARSRLATSSAASFLSRAACLPAARPRARTAATSPGEGVATRPV